MSKTIIFDNGHGAINPSTGLYVTPGKRMIWTDFSFYEGVWNREVVAKLIKLCDFHNIPYINLVPEWQDISLSRRVKRANLYYHTNKDCLLLSVHSNGFKKELANGFESFIYRNASRKSKEYQEIFHSNYIEVNDSLKDRGMKTSGFYIVKYTNMPAVLLECAFYTNREECLYLINEQDKIVEGIFNGILEIVK